MCGNREHVTLDCTQRTKARRNRAHAFLADFCWHEKYSAFDWQKLHTALRPSFSFLLTTSLIHIAFSKNNKNTYLFTTGRTFHHGTVIVYTRSRNIDIINHVRTMANHVPLNTLNHSIVDYGIQRRCGGGHGWQELCCHRMRQTSRCPGHDHFHRVQEDLPGHTKDIYRTAWSCN